MNFLDLDPNKMFPEESGEEEYKDTERIEQGARLNSLVKSGGLDEIMRIFLRIEDSAWAVVKTKPVTEAKQLAEMTQYARVVSEVIKNFRNEVNKSVTAASKAQGVTA